MRLISWHLRNYLLGVAGRRPRTFTVFVKRVRSFLFRAPAEGSPMPERWGSTFQTVSFLVSVRRKPWFSVIHSGRKKRIFKQQRQIFVNQDGL